MKSHSNAIKTNSNFVTRMHPLMAVAAASVIVVSLVGAAALAGMLPNSRADVPAALTASEQAQLNHSSASTTPQKHQNHTPANQVAAAEAQPAPAQPAAAKHNSAVGIGFGAVVGGLLGNQVGSGDGKTLATVAGAVGGAYVGNEIAKKNQ